MPTYTFDITPFVPLLADSKAHNFSIVVEGQGPNLSTGDYWTTNGSVSLTLDPSGKQTTGKLTKHVTDNHVNVQPLPSPPAAAGQSANVDFLVTANRTLTIAASVITGSGTNDVEINQKMSFSNKQAFSGGASRQVSTHTFRLIFRLQTGSH